MSEVPLCAASFRAGSRLRKCLSGPTPSLHTAERGSELSVLVGRSNAGNRNINFADLLVFVDILNHVAANLGVRNLLHWAGLEKPTASRHTAERGTELNRGEHF